MGMSLAALESFERLLTMQIERDDNPALQKKLAAVRVQIEEAEAAICRDQIRRSVV